MAKRACSPAPSNGARRLLWVTLPIILRGVSRSTVLTQMAAALPSFPSRPVLSHPIPSHPVQSHPILSRPVPSHPMGPRCAQIWPQTGFFPGLCHL